ncbi:MAG: PSP1 domain-containing protein [Nitrospirota bacterium]|nr:PSP1 domain-containing protein [Nitrospirota bacterium]
MTDQSAMTPEIDQEPTYPESVLAVGVKVRDCGEILTAKTEDENIVRDDYVLLTLDEDTTYAKVYSPPQRRPFVPPMRVMQNILRKASPEDLRNIEQQQKISAEGIVFCRERAEGLGLHLKLVEVFGSFQRRALTFCYTSESRIDFRQLVKDLARHFSCRIEMRQISSREEARRLSGVDSCGLVLCCSTFLTDFKPVNLKLSRRESTWSGDSHRIGVCGRLKCCLMFEQDDWPVHRAAPQPPIRPTRSTRS